LSSFQSIQVVIVVKLSLYTCCKVVKVVKLAKLASLQVVKFTSCWSCQVVKAVMLTMLPSCPDVKVVKLAKFTCCQVVKLSKYTSFQSSQAFESWQVYKLAIEHSPSQLHASGTTCHPPTRHPHTGCFQAAAKDWSHTAFPVPDISLLRSYTVYSWPVWLLCLVTLKSHRQRLCRWKRQINYQPANIWLSAGWEATRAVLRDSLSITLNVDLNEKRWLQASLSIKWGGSGVRGLPTWHLPQAP